MGFHLKPDLELIHKNKLNLFFPFFFLEKQGRPCTSPSSSEVGVAKPTSVSGGNVFQKVGLNITYIEYIELVKSELTTSKILLYTL